MKKSGKRSRHQESSEIKAWGMGVNKLASEEFVAIIPGASSTDQVKSNVKSWKSEILIDFWKELKSAGLIYEKAQTPA